jgi:hypothetical protein
MAVCYEKRQKALFSTLSSLSFPYQLPFSPKEKKETLIRSIRRMHHFIHDPSSKLVGSISAALSGLVYVPPREEAAGRVSGKACL